MRTKLLDFLEYSKHFTPQKLLAKYNQQLQDEGLYEERAILLSKIGEHESALKEYTHRLFDLKKAEDYCVKHYNIDNDVSKDVYLSLLKVYLTKPVASTNAEDPVISEIALQEAAFKLLNKHYKEIDTPKALDLLPEETRILKLYPYFEVVLRDLNQKRRNNQVQMYILRSESMKVKRELIKYRSDVVHITDDTYCADCERPLGNAVPVRYPNGNIVHYKCHLAQMQKTNSTSTS